MENGTDWQSRGEMATELMEFDISLQKTKILRTSCPDSQIQLILHQTRFDDLHQEKGKWSIFNLSPQPIIAIFDPYEKKIGLFANI